MELETQGRSVTPGVLDPLMAVLIQVKRTVSACAECCTRTYFPGCGGHSYIFAVRTKRRPPRLLCFHLSFHTAICKFCTMLMRIDQTKATNVGDVKSVLRTTPGSSSRWTGSRHRSKSSYRFLRAGMTKAS